MNIVLLGGPGAGKGTLAKQLRAKYGYFILSPGDLYRREAELETEFGLRAKEYWADGNLCPDEMTNELVRKTVNELPDGCPIIFDGYPRRRSQAEYLDSICNVELVIELRVRDDVVVDRLLRRKEIENRPDDTEEVIRQRLDVYHENNDPILEYYRGYGDSGGAIAQDFSLFKEFKRYAAFNAEGTIKESFDLADSIIATRKGV